MAVAAIGARTTHARDLSKRLFMYRHSMFILLIDLAVCQTKVGFLSKRLFMYRHSIDTDIIG